ncbi:MAG: ABC transporter ATP-binding protein [Halioglobus sp.]
MTLLSKQSATLDKPVVSVKGVSKHFCRDLKKSLKYGVADILRDLVPLQSLRREAGQLRDGEFYANKDISFDLYPGECLGLIGHNGAGKTTLLKMLNGLIKPDAGIIEMRGQVGALIALGAGFNPILSGRENIYINAAVLGLNREEVDSKLDEIIAFSEIEEFIDSPVQSYSSGMQVRLGFSVATALQPEILLVDEVLAVGDMNFRMKCFNRIDSLAKQGTTIILVSHSMIDIQRMCSRAIVLEHGGVVFDGGVGPGIIRYEELGLNRLSKVPSDTRDTVYVESFSIMGSSDSTNVRAAKARTGDSLEVNLTIQVSSSISDARVRIFFESMSAGLMSSLSSASELDITDLGIGTHSFSVTIREIPYMVGIYNVGVAVHGNTWDLPLRPNRLATLEITGPEVKTSNKTHAGLVMLANDWSYSGIE